MDQATAANPETGVAESSGEPVVEITPTSNGVQVKVGSEEFIEEPPSCFNGGEKNGLVEVPEVSMRIHHVMLLITSLFLGYS